MPKKKHRTEWRSVVLDMAIETSSMEVLRRGRRQVQPVTRVVFRAMDGEEFSGPRISAALRHVLEHGAARGPWGKARRV